MSLFKSQLLILSSSGATTYAGDSSTSLLAWGAQVELGQSYDIVSQDYANYRYMRTVGAIANFLSTRLGTTADGDFFTVGFGALTAPRWSGSDLEKAAFLITKPMSRGIDLGTAVSSQIVVTSSYTVTSVTNLLPYSEQFTNATYWGIAGAYLSSNVTYAPDGSLTATKFIEGWGTGFRNIYQTRYALDNENVTFSIFAKAAERSELYIQLSNFVNEVGAGFYDLRTGVATVQDGIRQDYPAVSASMVSVGTNGWWRLNLTVKKARYDLYPQSNPNIYLRKDGQTNYAGDGTSGIYIWGAHIGQNAITNLQTYSEEISGAGWGTGSDSLNIPTPNVAFAPDGTQTADLITFSDFSGSGYRYSQFITPRALPNATYTYSTWLWSSSAGQKIGLRITNSLDGADHAFTSITLTAVPTRYQITRTFTGGSAPTNSVIEVGYDNRTIVGGQGVIHRVLAWGAQLEAGSSMSAYIRTTSAAVTVSSYVSRLGYPLYNRTTSNLAVATSTSAGFTVPVSSTANRLLYSEDFSQTGTWLDANGPVVRTFVVEQGPPEFNYPNAYILNKQGFGADVGVEQVFSSGSPFGTATVFNVSLFVRQVDTAFMDLYTFFTGASVRGSYVRYNFLNNTIVAGSAEGPGNVPWNVGRTLYSDGWVRIFFSINDPLGTNTGFQFRIYPAGRQASQGRIYAWGAQVTTQADPYAATGNPALTPYLRTTSANILYSAISSITLTYTSLATVVTTSYTLTQSFSGNATITGLDPERLYVGQQWGNIRQAGDSQERLAVSLDKVIEAGATVSDDRRAIPSNPVTDAARIAGIFVASPTAQTFSYNRYTPVAGDNVYYNANDWFSEVGRSQRARMAIGSDTQSKFVHKRLDEVKQIPHNAKFDALAVAGINLVRSTPVNIDTDQYSPLFTDDVTYYKAYDWYSDVQRSQRAFFAAGISYDGSPHMIDSFSFGDNFTYEQNKYFADRFFIGNTTEPGAGKNNSLVESTRLLMQLAKPETLLIGNTEGFRVNDSQEFVSFTNLKALVQPEFNVVPTEDITKQTLLVAKNGSRNILQTVVRNNRLTYSEKFTQSFWATSGTAVTSGTVIMSEYLPYRNVTYDANQILEMSMKGGYTTPATFVAGGSTSSAIVYNEGVDWIGGGSSRWSNGAGGAGTQLVIVATASGLISKLQSMTIGQTLVIKSYTTLGGVVFYTSTVTLASTFSLNDLGGGFIEFTATVLETSPGFNEIYDSISISGTITTTGQLVGSSIKNWYQLTPLTNRVAFTSNGISLLTVSSSNTEHYLTASTDLGAENYFNVGMYVNNQQGVTRVRVDAGLEGDVAHYADFDISTGEVITSVNVIYATIQAVDADWNLLKIMGPVTGTADLIPYTGLDMLSDANLEYGNGDLLTDNILPIPLDLA